MGDGSLSNHLIPVDITSEFNLNDGENIISASLGKYHSSALTSTNRLFTWGRNDHGQLGDETTIDKLTPNDITSQFSFADGEIILSLSLGGYHSSVLTSTNRLFTWGQNNYGQLGDDTTLDQSIPTDITTQFSLSSGENIIYVELGASNSSVITSTGRMFTWGLNLNGQLGDGTTTNKISPIDITTQFNLSDGETILSGSFRNDHSLAITSLNRLFTWGRNSNGQLGDGTKIDKLTPVDITSQFNFEVGETILSLSIGGIHTSLVTSQERMFTWGRSIISQSFDGVSIELTPTPSRFRYIDSSSTLTYDYQENVDEYLPERSGYIFDGWYEDMGLTTPYTFSTMPNEDIILYASWINSYTISFDTNGGSLIDPIMQNYGSNVIAPSEPIREGYTFDGWFMDEALTVPYTFTTMLNKDRTIYAKWMQNMTISEIKASEVIVSSNIIDTTGPLDGEFVSIENVTVVAKDTDAYWISDGTTTLMVYDAPTNVQIGQKGDIIAEIDIYYGAWQLKGLNMEECYYKITSLNQFKLISFTILD